MRSINYFGYEVFENGDVIGKRAQILKLRKSDRGYLYFKFCNNGKLKNVYVHKLIMKLFIENPENKLQGNHKNGIKTDNRLENLEWCTASENIIHAYQTELKKYIRPVIQFDKNGKLIAEYKSQSEAKRITGICNANISKNLKGELKTAGGYVWKSVQNTKE